ncbi:LLM class F420-dependent oxidoreductase [Frankia canadensis]|uniref:LLM class F420-dependent oxidoreductase n=1 Tax=Frankia canadensis TaxID=1836972 RepID=A0A2I2KX06_9ACTN|nr:LLM class F420-dependent oxidoreductase [Frankia canadensis]SNQ50194.1 LLM class F420-dependent oxidoreductase [Frankia canadensis]SOU57484.1 LLM class F420-dependent oxidoreductase [Frankia canadensis]
MQTGRIGIWSMDLERQPLAAARQAVAELDELGFPTLWIPEAVGKEVMSHAALLLTASDRIIVATGIANLWARDATAMANAQRTLTEGFPERFLLGVGVSHGPTVANRGHAQTSPLQATREYLAAMDAAVYAGASTDAPLRRVLAALGPRMLDLAAELTAGAHTYTVPVEHTAVARKRLGEGPLLIPEQKVVLVSDPSEARRIARRNLGRGLRLPNYANNLRRLGFTDDDLAERGSDRLIDALVAWGDLDAVRRRVDEHLDAGADHVALQVLVEDPKALPLREWRELAALLD